MLAALKQAPPLPQERDETPAPVPRGADLPGVLVVEDVWPVARVIARAFETSGHRATCVRTARQAMDAVSRETPDLVVLDFGLPDLPGMELLREIKSDPSLAGVPVLIITGDLDEETRVRATLDGSDGYLVKPFRTEEIVGRAVALIRRSRERSTRQGPGAAHPAAPADPCSTFVRDELTGELEVVRTAIQHAHRRLAASGDHGLLAEALETALHRTVRLAQRAQDLIEAGGAAAPTPQ